MSSARERPLALTSGDPAGIGLEISLAAWLARDREALPPFVLIADPALVRARAAEVGHDVPLVVLAPTDPFDSASSLFATHLPVVPPIAPSRPAHAGRPDPANADAILSAIRQAVDLTIRGMTAAVVTNPIAKHVLYQAGFRHPGHTEYLAALAHAYAPGARAAPPRPLMCLTAEPLTVVPLTIHIPLREVPDAITHAALVETIEILADALRIDFGVATPRIAVAGLNPHAGENGTIGREDADIIAPALAELRTSGLDVVGPLPADTMFHPAARANYDAAVTMYHDQGLIPIKTLAFDTGVNATLGLPFVRTSPDHGTAFDIAGQGTASPASLIAALKAARRFATNRQRTTAGQPS